MAGSTPLQRWRQGGRWPECLDRIWGQLEQRHGRSAGTREMITLVRVGSVAGWERLIAAVEEALRLGVTDAAAVLHILNMPDPEQRRRYAWDCHKYYDRREGIIKDNLVAGVRRLAKSVGLKPYLPDDLQRTLEALFDYRNQMFHNGFEWPAQRCKDFAGRVTAQC